MCWSVNLIFLCVCVCTYMCACVCGGCRGERQSLPETEQQVYRGILSQNEVESNKDRHLSSTSGLHVCTTERVAPSPYTPHVHLRNTIEVRVVMCRHSKLLCGARRLWAQCLHIVGPVGLFSGEYWTGGVPGVKWG